MKTNLRIAALRRFAIAITVFNLLGHTLLGFEQSWAQPLAALVAAYVIALLLEALSSIAERRAPGFTGGLSAFVDFLLPAHITGLACAMLLYANDRVMPVVFAVAVALSSKTLLRVTVDGRARHYFNPSNFGIVVTLLAFPWVGIAQPYMFTENLSGAANWILPGVIVISGSFLNAKFTRRIPLIASWATVFAVQAAARTMILGTPLSSALAPMTGVAFILFSVYMLTDPATTPVGSRGQILFGGGVAATYGALMTMHFVFGLFFSLAIVSVVRGSFIWATQATRARVSAIPPQWPAAVVRRP